MASATPYSNCSIRARAASGSSGWVGEAGGVGFIGSLTGSEAPGTRRASGACPAAGGDGHVGLDDVPLGAGDAGLEGLERLPGGEGVVGGRRRGRQLGPVSAGSWLPGTRRRSGDAAPLRGSACAGRGRLVAAARVAVRPAGRTAGPRHALARQLIASARTARRSGLGPRRQLRHRGRVPPGDGVPASYGRWCSGTARRRRPAPVDGRAGRLRYGLTAAASATALGARRARSGLQLRRCRSDRHERVPGPGRLQRPGGPVQHVASNGWALPGTDRVDGAGEQRGELGVLPADGGLDRRRGRPASARPARPGAPGAGRPRR